MTLHISAGLAILVGLFFAHGYRYPVHGLEAYIFEHFALQWVFVTALVGGGALAIWLAWRALLAAAWGMVLGLNARHLIHPATPLAVVKQVVAMHGSAYAVGTDITRYVIVAVALLGLILCGASELRRTARGQPLNQP